MKNKQHNNKMKRSLCNYFSLPLLSEFRYTFHWPTQGSAQFFKVNSIKRVKMKILTLPPPKPPEHNPS